ncbi:unnamed protein product [Cylindrotheca closterium]|uniref:Uncharacterized protein n=1 Tax=Cylindrotheca closterium TaxID=2856 RepID=A0AAD2FQ98_9STRA|nr:unnamed protein product [Cylindrotheca closterium]
MSTTLATSSRNNSQSTYPSANAVLLDNGNSAYTSPSMGAVVGSSTITATAPKEPSFHDQYATAQVVGADVSPFSTRLAHATETHATATALDPWSKQKTVATEQEQQSSENARPTFVYSPPPYSGYTSPNDYGNNHGNDNNGINVNANNNNETAVLPAAALEDPLRKKYRRRTRRRGRMLVGGAAGFVVGSILLGPIGAVALGIGGASVVKSASKARERRKDRRVQRQIQQFQRQREQGDLQRIAISRR